MSRIKSSRWWAVAPPALAVAMVAAASVMPAGGSVVSNPPRPVEVVESSYACPGGSIITLAAGQVRPGASRTVHLSPEGTPDPDLSDAGVWSSASVDAAGAIITETGRDTGASGFFAGRAPASGGGGLVVGECAGVIDDAWFLGAGSGDRHFSTLILTNLSSTPAVADILLWGPDGPVDAVNASGVTLAPYEIRRTPVADLAAGEAALAIEVVRTRGSMSAIVNDSSTATFAGTEPISATLTPTRDQYVGGVVGGARGKTLMLLNPGESTARVDVEVLARSGTFAGKGLQDIKVEPGQFLEVEVPAEVGKGRQAFHVSSDQPVAASVRVSANAKDYSIAEATAPLDGAALVPVSAGSNVKIPELVLTAPGKTSSVDIEAFDASMKSLASSSVGVEGGTTVHVASVNSKDPYASDVAYVVVRGTGGVIAAAQYVKGEGVSSLALRAAPVVVSAPSVRRID